MSDELCPIIDTTGVLWEWPCDQPFVDPCLPGGSTLFHVAPCTPADPPLPEWCITYATHPACVQNGLPKLPPTGSAPMLPITATGLIVAGMLCVWAGRKHRRVRH